MVLPTVMVVAVLVLVCVLFLVLSGRISHDTLPRPDGMLSGFGVRIPSTLASDAAWRASHRAIRPLVVAVAVVSAVGAALALLLLLLGQVGTAFVVSLVAVGVMILASVAITARAHVVATQTVG